MEGDVGSNWLPTGRRVSLLGENRPMRAMDWPCPPAAATTPRPHWALRKKSPRDDVFADVPHRLAVPSCGSQRGPLDLLPRDVAASRRAFCLVLIVAARRSGLPRRSSCFFLRSGRKSPDLAATANARIGNRRTPT
ncbi:hypothetical protein PVAP13_3KG312100 [Panicum virgatum]|uniref:Uncharacterized protein n=1 Tax=Panicum virgatum TaxID=38727 RepID=A0A8T0USH2_PANVG|nr:hypothetical protein PVAP13_3KG312100 [Panicum virgatum]